nr:MAG TPA: tail assembly chaperone protein [Caudoviricetes sp.]
MQTYELIINSNKYVLRSANFFETKTQLQSLLGLAKDAIKMQGEDVNIDVGQIIANIGSPAFSGVENFILKYASAINAEGGEILLKNVSQAETHFNANRGDYAQLIFEGLKYHFLDFLPAGVKSLAGITAYLNKA